MSNIFTVRELTANIKGNLEKHFPFVWVKGEVSNLARPSSGHIYFALKDNDALLNCVWFKNAQRTEEKFDPLTGEVFEDGPRPSMSQKIVNGQEILCAGNVSVYAPRGGYQLIVQLVQESGRGALFAAFEALKIKLEAQGYFSATRKRSLPINPKRVAIITAPTGAAIQDFLRIASERGTGSQIDIYPVPVQGEAAAPAIALAFAKIAERVREDVSQAPEVIVLIRGGGSLEDLWAFNEEAVAQAIFTAPLPVLAGIGHEVDISIADLTADVRAATPTHAAQLLWLSRDEYVQRVDGREMAVHSAGEAILRRCFDRLSHKEQALKWLSPVRAWQRKEDLLKQYVQKLQWIHEKTFESKKRELDTLTQKLPFILNKYSTAEAELASLQLRLEHNVQRNFSLKEQYFSRHEHVLAPLMQKHMTQQETLLQKLLLELKVYDPLAPLSRGYALLQNAEGKAVRSVTDVHSGQEIHLQVADGSIDATVNNIFESTLKN